MTMRSRRVYETDGLVVKLSYYGAGLAMPAHSHDFHQVSFLLGGGLSERHGGAAREMHQQGIGVKPAGFAHDNRYHDRDGALILSVNFRPGAGEALAGLSPDDWRWAPHRPPARLPELYALLAADSRTAGDAVVDLLARSGVALPARSGPPPVWLARVRDRLDDPDDTADIAAIAAEAGLHRVYLSRVFSAHYGVSPSVYRLRRRVGRTLSLLAAGMPLSEVAADAGFADQAHMTRSLKRQTGLTPKALRGFLAAA
jgi:AraC-like DNA-binding protein